MTAHEQIKFRHLCRQLFAGQIDAEAFSAATLAIGPLAWSTGQIVAERFAAAHSSSAGA